MVNTKSFMIVFIAVYFLMSLPGMLAIGYVIDWVPEATLIQKFKGYVIEGLTNNFKSKIVSSAIASAGFNFVLSRRIVKKSSR